MIVPLIVIAVLVALYFILKKLGFFRGVAIHTGNNAEGVYYFKNFEGNYEKLGGLIEEMKGIIKKFKKENKYFILGIYYDNAINPSYKKTDPNKCRATIGIFKKKLSSKFKIDEELETYVTNDLKLNKTMLPKVKCLLAEWTYSNKIAMMKGMKVFYDQLFANLQQESYCNSLHIDKSALSCAYEVYEHKKIMFYVPTENISEFMLFEDKQ